MFGNGARDLPWVRSYEEAAIYFDRTRKPPRSKNWAEHQRPLKDVRHTHYRLEREISINACPPHYSLYLYRTEMVRYYAPDADGSRRVWIKTHWSQTSRNFMDYVAYIPYYKPKFTTTEGNEVICPLMQPGRYGTEWSAKLVFVGENWRELKLDVARSWHIPVGLPRLSKDSKLERKEKLKELQPLLNIAALRLPDLVSKGNPEFRPAPVFAVPFASTETTSILHRVDARKPLEMWPEEWLAAFNEMLQTAANEHVARVAATKDGEWERHTYSRWQARTTKYEIPERAVEQVLDNPSGFLRIVQTRLLESARLTAKTGVLRVPPFPEQLPRTVGLKQINEVNEQN